MDAGRNPCRTQGFDRPLEVLHKVLVIGDSYTSAQIPYPLDQLGIQVHTVCGQVGNNAQTASGLAEPEQIWMQGGFSRTSYGDLIGAVFLQQSAPYFLRLLADAGKVLSGWTCAYIAVRTAPHAPVVYGYILHLGMRQPEERLGAIQSPPQGQMTREDGTVVGA